MVFGFLQKRMIRETAKLVRQNALALPYLQVFEPELVVKASRQIESLAIIWQPGKKLDPNILSSIVDTNRQLRRAYDQTPGRHAKSFDQEFQPILGWKDYFTELGI